MIGTLLLMVIVLTGCNAPTPTPLPITRAAPVIVPSPIVIVVVSTPLPTATPLPSPPPSYEIRLYEGRWQLRLVYHFQNIPYFRDIRYDGALDVQVDANGSITGAGTIYPLISTAPCGSQIREGGALNFTVSGRVDAPPNFDPDGSRPPLATLSLRPADLYKGDLFSVGCVEPSLFAKNWDINLLWESLRATDQLTFRIVLASPRRITRLTSLTGATGGTIPGVVTSEIQVGR
jgi:hypothetical protein